MKIRIIAAILLPLALFSARAFAAELGAARMGIVQGDVQVYTEDAQAWVPASINTPLAQGDRVWVPDGGRSELQFQGGLVVRLDAVTSFDILSLDENTFQFYVNVGRTYVNNRTYGVEYLQVDTPVGSIGCYDNSLTMIDVEENGTTEVSVLKGYAYAETRNGKIRVPAGKTLRIGEDLQAELFPLSSPDEWEEWNRTLDGRIGDGASLRYLPDELYDYGYDFDTYGRWLYDTSYGYVWTPTFSISVNWAPYQAGRWIWIGGHYVWISREPWGWAPYHYGRWVNRPHVGWCWVPPRHGAVWWGPGYVGWVYTTNYVAWVPLAPGDIYYGHGYYGPGSVNLNTIVINNIIINRNYRNRNVRNAVRTMKRNAFLHGRKGTAPAWNNPFGQRNVGIGPPRFKPEKATFAPTLKTIPATRQPPRRIRQINPKKLQSTRKVMPDKQGSAFTPGTPARIMPTTARETPRRIQREQTPEFYRDRQLKPKAAETPKKKQSSQKKPVTIIRPGTQKSTGKQAAPPAATRLQPATIKVAPQPVAPQPVAPTQVWSPTPARQPTQRVSPTRRQAIPATAPKVRQGAPATPRKQIETPQPSQQQRQQTIQRQQQTIRRLNPATSQPAAAQTPTSRGTAPATTTPAPRQPGGRAGEKTPQPGGNAHGQNR